MSYANCLLRDILYIIIGFDFYILKSIIQYLRTIKRMYRGSIYGGIAIVRC